jgi:S-methylmethionine-dependent homocysteine/selenocysteine methylase
MSKYRTRLPQISGERLFITDGGLETTLIFHHGIELPSFAAFPLLDSEQGRATLTRYFETYLAIAAEVDAGFILESATWRASPDWGALLGFSPSALATLSRRAIEMLEPLRAKHETEHRPIVISGCIGPRGDGYIAGDAMTVDEAAAYHRLQIEAFRDTAADMITAITMTNVPEATGIARAAGEAEMPVAISFTVETDGRLPSGDTLRAAIEAVDAATHAAPVYYMINCAHPTHFDGVLDDAPWCRRIRGLRANASTCSHAELNESTTLDIGDPLALAEAYGRLRTRFPQLNVFGGCCGTDERHVGAIAHRCSELGARRRADTRPMLIAGVSTFGLLGLVMDTFARAFAELQVY